MTHQLGLSNCVCYVAANRYSLLFVAVRRRSSPFVAVLRRSSPFFAVRRRSSPFFTVRRRSSPFVTIRVFQLNAKLHVFQKETWIEKGRGWLRLNDMSDNETAAFQSRLGAYRVLRGILCVPCSKRCIVCTACAMCTACTL